MVCGVEIVNYHFGSEPYRNIDLYFHYVVDLLVQEVERIGYTLFQEKEREDEEDMLDSYREDFRRISKHKLELNKEMVTYLYKHEEPLTLPYNNLHGHSPPPPKIITQPLFSGLVGRSVLDTRCTTVPEPYLLAKVVGSAPTSDLSLMKSFNYGATRIPAPNSSAQVLESFFHPNWYTVETSKWLTYKQKSLNPPLDSKLVKHPKADDLRAFEKNSNIVSFAPSADLRKAVMSKDTKLAVWFSDIGYDKLSSIHKKIGADVVQPEVSTSSLTAAIEEKPQENGVKSEKTEAAASEIIEKPKSNEIKLKNLALFVPEAKPVIEELRKENASVESARGVQRVISLNLLKLQKLRQKRFLQSANGSAPSPIEIATYQKILKLLTLLVDLKAGEEQRIDSMLSKKLPVLLNDYSGTLPGSVSSKPALGGKTGRLASIRASYKKKSRF